MPEILGGALLIFSVWEDLEYDFIDMDEVLRKVRLIKMYESGELCLKGLNLIW